MNKKHVYIISYFLLSLLLVALLYTLPTHQYPASYTTSPSTTTRPSTTSTTSTTTRPTTTTSTATTATTQITNRTSPALQEIIKIIDYLENRHPLEINNSLIKPLLVSAEYYWMAQKMYEKFGGHGLVPLRSLDPSEIRYYFSPYSLEVSEYACEIPYLYAWMYWLTSNSTWLERTKYSIDAVKYWSIDHLMLGGCWGSTDPIVYDKYTSKYIVRWKLVTWYTQTQLSWWDEEWFKKNVYNSWRYITWHDQVYNWTWFSAWETIYHGPVEEQEKFKQAFTTFVHVWINNITRLNITPYAYLLRGSDFKILRGASASNDILVFKYNPLTTRKGEAVLKTPIYLKSNTAYHILLRIGNYGGKVNLKVILEKTGTSKTIVYEWPVLLTNKKMVNITIGNIFVHKNEEGEYTLKIIVSPLTGMGVNVKVQAVGVLATPNMGLYGLSPRYGFWGDTIGPLAVTLLHYYPEMKQEVLEAVKTALREILEWRTDSIFYPPDKKWVFLYWDSSENGPKALRLPQRGKINYASLEETLESMIPLLILTGDPELKNLLIEAAKLLNHDNYWKGLGYWSAWFGIWTHLYLYNVTGDNYFWNEASYYIGTMKPFQESLDEEVSNVAKFIEANIVAYYITGDEKYLDIAHKMAGILVKEYTNPNYGYITPYRGSIELARHDMLAWTAAPLISLYINEWVPDWMLWLYPIALSDNSRPNGYFTVVNTTYIEDAIYIWSTRETELFMFKYNGYIVSPQGFRALQPTPRDYFPYTAKIELLEANTTASYPVIVGFNSTNGSFTINYGENQVLINSSQPRVWIIKLHDNTIKNIVVDGKKPIEGRNMILHQDYLVIIGRVIIINYSYDTSKV